MPRSAAFRPTDRWGPAWALSVLVHAALLGPAAWWGGGQQGMLPGVQEREIGVVLRRSEAEPERLDQVLEPTLAEPREAPPLDLAALTPPAEASPLITDLLAELTAAPAPPPQAGAASGSAGAARPELPYGQTRVSVFGLEATGGRFVYAFDRSMSMRGTPLKAAKQQLVASLEALSDIHKFQILFFNHSVSAFDLSGGRNRVAFGTEANKQRAADFVSGITADGNTLRLPALEQALKLRPDAVFFLTDADDPMTARQLMIIEEMAGSATINTIEFGVGKPTARSNFLMRLAEATGGGYVYVDTQKLGR
ncbi:hypothetical protein [Botrimarina hoheduenensis]|uniref:VWFA domain-containing protein n=1 Tax=Botrimarina hoheduenensis TaxID=2528000 RepID=A0A5C5WA23_9BACT|nr:hypothetical protein [Botrimarina hoheduenensis]TWT46472.1 hypothetical protein Pla111_15680 [Botrimarina hoheduenensis]